MLFELGLAEFQASPTLETIRNVTAPFFIFAKLRMDQDTTCLDDPSLKEAGAQMLLTYLVSLNNLTNQNGFCRPQVAAAFSYDKLIASKISDLAKRFLKEKLPPPYWISSHGTQRADAPGTLKPENEWAPLREAYMNTILDELNKMT